MSVVNHVSRPKAAWTAEEDETLRQMNAHGIRYVEIARVVGKTTAAVERRRCVLGLPSRTEVLKGMNHG